MFIFFAYLGIVRSCLIQSIYSSFLLPNNLTGALLRNLITFSIDLTLETFNLKQLFLSLEIIGVRDKYLRIADTNISPLV
jgi:hypothetical protein